MNISRLLIFIALIITPHALWAQCHHGTGHSHHSSGHSFSHHSSGHVATHFRSQHCGRGGRSSGSYYRADAGEQLALPLKGRSDVSAGAGVVSAWQVLDKSINIAGPNTFFSYNHFLSDGFAIGFTAASQNLLGRDTCFCTPAGSGNEPLLYDFNINTVTLAATITYLYLSRNAVQCYGSLGLGASVYYERDRYVNNTFSNTSGFAFNGHLTAFGVRFGKDLGGFLELGFGYKGVLCGGISYQPQLSAGKRYAY